MLTNTATIGGRIKHLKDIEARMANGELAARYSKLEVQRFAEEIEAMNQLYSGIKEMAVKLGAVFVVDVLNDDIAVKEARKLGVPIVALIDTNADPGVADYPIPCNDDATKTINLIMDYVQSAIEAGKGKAKKPSSEPSRPSAEADDGKAARRSTAGKPVDKTEEEPAKAEPKTKKAEPKAETANKAEAAPAEVKAEAVKEEA
jgi:small subunit ribosomal protein S2